MNLTAATARQIALVAAVALVVDLLLGWHHTEIGVAGVLDVGATSAGWANAWGALAGVLALVLAGLELAPRSRPRVAFALAVAMALAVALAVFTGHVEVDAPAVETNAGSPMWPAWLGLALALTAVVATQIAARRR